GTRAPPPGAGVRTGVAAHQHPQGRPRGPRPRLLLVASHADGGARAHAGDADRARQARPGGGAPRRADRRGPGGVRRGLRVLAAHPARAAGAAPLLPLAALLRSPDAGAAVPQLGGLRAHPGEDRPGDGDADHGAHPGERHRRCGTAGPLRRVCPGAAGWTARMRAGEAVAGRDPVGRGLDVLAATQDADGSWKGDYGGPLFLVPVYVAGLQVLGREPEPAVREGFVTYLRNHQNPDGGWGLDVESHSHVFTSVLNYVTLRLLGIPASDPGLERARDWFLPRGGPLGSGSWGKFILALLGLYAYQGLVPGPPELWLLPESWPLPPAKLWGHCPMVYPPMSWLYARRVRAPETPLLAEIRKEIYAEPYDSVDWGAAREMVSETDAYTPRTSFLRLANAALGIYERFAPAGWRERALEVVLDQIR